MTDDIREGRTLDEATAAGIKHPGGPYEHITFACVVWQDADRLDKLLAHVRPWFDKLAVVVQRSTDDTLAIASDWADIIATDEHRGFGDASFGPKLLPQVKTTWTFKCDVDEWPSDELLDSLGAATWAADMEGVKGVWIPFRSAVEGLYWEQEHSHLRLFWTSLGWPGTLHSRPPVYQSIIWRTGSIDHSRSLDEMIADYLRYYEIGKGNPGWTEHNQMMMRSACQGVAEAKGWGYVKAFSWWPKVLSVAFAGVDPPDTMDPLPTERRPEW